MPANALISIAKKYFIAIFLPRVLTYQKREISLPRDKSRRLGTIVTSFQDIKLRRKQVSQSFSVLL